MLIRAVDRHARKCGTCDIVVKQCTVRTTRIAGLSSLRYPQGDLQYDRPCSSAWRVPLLYSFSIDSGLQTVKLFGTLVPAYTVSRGEPSRA